MSSNPVIDQHDTWLVVKPVRVCPKGCSYCYLLDLGQSRAKPIEIATSAVHVQWSGLWASMAFCLILMGGLL
jgi:DNA repair photolyase